MDTNHPAVQASAHHAHTPHYMYWSGLKEKAEHCVHHVFKEGSSSYTLHDALGKDNLTEPEDWDDIMEFCREKGASQCDLDDLYRASVAWLQAYHELEYKRMYP